MGLFYNYQESGKGIAKNGPKKKPFFKFWEIFANKFWKLIYANVLFVLFSGLVFVVAGIELYMETKNPYTLLVCLPALIGFGPTCAAMSQVMRKYVIEKPIFLWNEFWASFKKNFKTALPVGIFDIAFIAAFAYGFNFYSNLVEQTKSTEHYVILGAMVALGVYVLMAHFYLYIQMVALNMSMRGIIKNSFLLTIVGIKRNIVTLAVTLLFGLLVYLFFPYSMLVLPIIPFGWLAFLWVFNAYPVIQKTIINPYYESRGERNPELPEEDNEEAIFTDRGGTEQEIKKVRSKSFGKVIK